MFYAKSEPVESLKEHTEALLTQYEVIKSCYGDEINKVITLDKDRFWYLLYLACKYHDLGKCNEDFQKIIKAKICKEKIGDIRNIPHGYLSPAFIPFKALELSKDERILLIQAIAYHHERDEEADKDLIKRIIEEDLSLKLDRIKEEMGICVNKLTVKYTKELETGLRITNKSPYYKEYVMLKGLLHRIDHSASAHHRAEERVEKEIGVLTKEYIENEFKAALREAQVFARNNKNKNVLLVASTGIGKTESALLWMDNNKGFFTLPLRVSINALYSRVKDSMNYQSLGLLHSTSMEYLEEKGYEYYDETYEQSRLFSKKVSFSTIDQLFKFPFKYRGYEKVYSTLAYSKVVIDEIQGYSPEICAVILKGIEMLNNIGGKFMIMTATLPRIYKDYLKEKNIDIEEGMFLSEVKRHKIKVVPRQIEEDLDDIINKGKDNKVIVIVNTVKKAMELYKAIENRKIKNLNLNMLHSMFIQKDRAILEQKIKRFADDEDENGNMLEHRNKGIWITTQIVEASLDIDFDYLYTEISTLDSLFQRLGRCYRKREFDKLEPNVYIYTLNPTGAKYIYDEEILEMSIKYIKEFDEILISEKDKVMLVDKLYSKENIKHTAFYKKFKIALEYLDSIIDFELTNSQAQKLLRDIDSVRVIPKEIYDANLELFEGYDQLSKEERRRVRRKINKISLSIPRYKCKQHIVPIGDFKDLYILKTKYDSGVGVLLDELLDNIY